MPPRPKPTSASMTPLPTAPKVSLQHWHDVSEPRSPWVPDRVRSQLDAWWLEVTNVAELVKHGERTYPLLLAGETRCGKTSSVCALAKAAGIPVYRLDLGSVVKSYMGETARVLSDAMNEMALGGFSIWLIDEIDGVAQQRGGDGAPDKERAHAVATLLTRLEHLSPTAPLVATTNTVDLIDAAVLARFTVVSWPRWDDLGFSEMKAFIASHGGSRVYEGSSYADAVQRARVERVERIIGAQRKD